ncbi:major facilitator superfamily domain-containing protein [Aspergillus novoparasiticus]|uniref:Major facilitator superfamily domain-containing protein n=1 Tax=Aspergillus novoparasiticus TaxID=986946 RepID=A0A5N6F412_9EURO|nr:major facilitator superfamily domain-containing protein [Aspergillus novoparasiticus]
MVAVQHTEELPSEATPLLNNSPTESAESNVPISFGRGFTIVAAMGLLLFTQATNMSMMTTAQSDIAADLDAFSETTWFTSAYLIATSSVTPLAGRLSQIFTPRVYVLFSCVLLSIGLFVTAAAKNLAVFLLGRALTGCGGGGIMVTTIILTLDLTSKKRRGLYIGLINVGMTTGISTGAVLAGLLTPAFGWRIIFWFQAPLCFILGPIQYFAIPSSSTNDEPLWGRALVRKLAKVDYGGALALSISVFLLLFSLSSPEIQLVPLILSLAAFAVFLFIESRFTSEPIIPVEVLGMRSVVLTCLSGLASMMARWSVLFFTPVYAMVVRNWSPASAGLILVPTNAGFGLGGVLVGWLHIRKTGSYYISNIIVFLSFALANLVLAVLSTPSSPTIAYLAVTFFNGLTAGALMNYSLSHLLHLTRPDVHYVVSALIAMSRGFAGSFGSAIGGGFFQRELKTSLETGFAAHGLPEQDELIRKLLGSPAMVKSLTGLKRLVAIQSYEHAVKTLLLGSCVLALVATVAQAGTGWRPERDDRKLREDLENTEEQE